MLPATLNLAQYFYPIGNTTPNDLTITLRPSEDADILLLGCGDIRNVLFTLHSSKKAPHSADMRKIDFTCCDIEPAVITRNILVLFAILEDEDASNNPLIWEIYYHIFLSTPALELLKSLVKKLLQATESMDEWHRSAHGSNIRFVSYDTLSQVRSYWQRYSTEAVPGKAAVLSAMSKLRSAKSSGYVLTSVRSAGPLFMQAAGVAPELHRHYWENGVVWGDAGQAVHTNPTMVVTNVRGTNFAVHYGTEPVLPFHLAPAFVELSSSDPLYRLSPGENPGSGNLAARIADFAKSQFRLWSSSYRWKAKQAYVRFTICDALTFCSTLAKRDEQSTTSTYTRQWTLVPISLDGGDYGDKHAGDSFPGPSSFNVIDTSNLTDHVGLLNLLVATLPCLQRRPSATLFTESLLKRENEANQVETFTELLLADQTAMFVLFGIAPVSYLTGASMQSSAMDSAQGLLGGQDPTKGQLQRRVGWKASHFETKNKTLFQMDAANLAKFLLAVYLKMFSVEGLGALANVAISKLSKMAVIHYTRSSFAELILFLSTTVNVDWEITVKLVLDHIAQDCSLLVGLSSIQDLYTQLYLRGLHTAPGLLSPPREMSHNLPPLQDSGPGILAQHLVGPVVCVNFVVPRASLDTLTNLDPTIVGTPALRAEINGPGWQNFFSTIQMSFGTVVASSDITVDFQEDLLGWRSRSDMIVSFLAPTWMLLLDSGNCIKISLDIQSTPGTTHLMSVFGLQLKIYEATLCDQEHVFVTAQLPKLRSLVGSGGLKLVQAKFSPLLTLADDVATLGPDIVLREDYKAIDKMKVRLDILDNSLKARLAEKSTAVEPIQRGPCSVTVKYGGHQNVLNFPFPMDVARSTVRVSRKSSYIEVLVPPWLPSHSGGYSSNPFPVSLSEEDPILLNVHTVCMESLPEVRAGRRMEWLETHAAMTLSARERRIRHPTMTSTDGLLNLKENLHSLFVSLSIPSGSADQIFALRHSTTGKIYALIFATTVRLDLSAQTVVADTHILPIAPPLPTIVDKFLRKNSTPVRNLLVSDDGIKSWSSFLAVSVERSRQNIWGHLASTCRYKASGRFPVSAISEASPLCGCGTGKASAVFRDNKAYGKLAPYVNRAALGLVFTVPFYEQIFSAM